MSQPTQNKITCPTCGQSVNARIITLHKIMVKSLIQVWWWCQKSNRHEFKRKDINPILEKNGTTVTANWGNWVYFGGLVYKPDGKASWGLNMDRVGQFIRGDLSIPTKVSKNPLTREIVKFDYKTIREIPSLNQYLDDNRQYIVQYL
jgi:hypothetical protein